MKIDTDLDGWRKKKPMIFPTSTCRINGVREIADKVPKKKRKVRYNYSIISLSIKRTVMLVLFLCAILFIQSKLSAILQSDISLELARIEEKLNKAPYMVISKPSGENFCRTEILEEAIDNFYQIDLFNKEKRSLVVKCPNCGKLYEMKVETDVERQPENGRIDLIFSGCIKGECPYCGDSFYDCNRFRLVRRGVSKPNKR